MSVTDRIRAAIEAGIDCWHLEVRDESHSHRVQPGSESHIRVIVVSPQFQGTSRVARHRAVNNLLGAEFAAGLHALAIEAVTPEQWQANGGPVLTPPPCKGAAKHAAG